MTKHTLKDFLDGRICVRCTDQNDKQNLLQFCADNGINKVWFSTLDIQQAVSMYNVFFIDCDSQTLTTIADVTSAFCTPIPFSSLVNDTSPRRIVIDYSDNITTATLYNGEKAIKSAAINRCHSDKPSVHVAAIEVIDKLLAKQVKQPKPKKTVEKDGFRVGDRVVCISDHFSAPNSVGQHGRIVAFDCFGNIGVEFDECQLHGHTCDGKVRSEHGRWLEADNLRHEQPAEPEVREVKRQAKTGEYIKLTEACYSFDKVGLILRVDRVNGCAVILNKNHPTSKSNSLVGSDFPWTYKKHHYVVLEGYQPEEPANA